MNQKQYGTAIPFLEEAIAIAHEIGTDDLISTAAYNMSICYRGIHQIENALKHARIVFDTDSSSKMGVLALRRT